jgi:hypothetical protein
VGILPAADASNITVRGIGWAKRKAIFDQYEAPGGLRADASAFDAKWKLALPRDRSDESESLFG